MKVLSYSIPYWGLDTSYNGITIVATWYHLFYKTGIFLTLVVGLDDNNPLLGGFWAFPEILFS